MTRQRELAYGDSWELVRAVQRGDRAVFADIYQRYSVPLTSYFLSRKLDRATAEDLTSETFIRAFQAIRTVSDQGKDLGSWLVTIARNLIYDYFKSSRVRHETSVSEVFDAGLFAKGPEDTVLASIELDEVSEWLTELTREQRQCLLLRRVCGYSVAETASMMDRSAEAVRALQHRAGRQLTEIAGRCAG
jgi:RNA polymerase sigma-70 factor (ECF subfamily)